MRCIVDKYWITRILLYEICNKDVMKYSKKENLFSINNFYYFL